MSIRSVTSHTGTFATLIGVLTLTGCGNSQVEPQSTASEDHPPNIVIILADDMGYADIASYGNPTTRTPVLDRLAHEGQRWTSFYSASSVCSPSRAGLLTGRLPIRAGVGPTNEVRRVFFPTSTGGLPHGEVTIAEVLKKKNYATAAIGKWHLGHHPEFLPMQQGFDSYYGIPYSNDMDAPGGISEPWTVELFFEEANINYWDVPLMQNEEVLERPANQWNITQRYTERAVDFIEQNKERPFFLYLAHSYPHTPLFTAEEFWGKSQRGHYGDVIEEIDWSVGQVIATLEKHGLENNTLVVFTSDNGPWLIMRQYGGSAGLLRDGKGTTWEGGMREPAIFWWPGKVQPGVVSDMGSTLDLLPTIANLAAIEMPGDRLYDGEDLSATLTAGAPSPRDTMFFYRLQDVYAFRRGPYKAHFITESSYGGEGRVELETPLLFNVDEDPSEAYDIAAEHPTVVEELTRLVAEHRAALEPVVNQLDLYPPGKLRGSSDDDDSARPWDQDTEATREQERE